MRVLFKLEQYINQFRAQILFIAKVLIGRGRWSKIG